MLRPITEDEEGTVVVVPDPVPEVTVLSNDQFGRPGTKRSAESDPAPLSKKGRFRVIQALDAEQAERLFAAGTILGRQSSSSQVSAYGKDRWCGLRKTIEAALPVALEAGLALGDADKQKVAEYLERCAGAPPKRSKKRCDRKDEERDEPRTRYGQLVKFRRDHPVEVVVALLQLLVAMPSVLADAFEQRATDLENDDNLPDEFKADRTERCEELAHAFNEMECACEEIESALTWPALELALSELGDEL